MKRVISFVVLVSFLGLNIPNSLASCTEKYRAALEVVNRDQNMMIANGQDFAIPQESSEGSPSQVVGFIGEGAGGYLAAAGAFASFTPMWPVVIAGAILTGVSAILGIYGDEQKEEGHLAYTNMVNDLLNKHSQQMTQISKALLSTFEPRAEVEEMYQWSTAIDAREIDNFKAFTDTFPANVSMKPGALDRLTKDLKAANDAELYCDFGKLMKPIDFKLLIIGHMKKNKDLEIKQL